MKKNKNYSPGEGWWYINYPSGEGGGTPFKVLYGEAPPERGTFFRLQVYERVGILPVEVYERDGKSVIWVGEMTQRAEQMNFMTL